MAMLYAAAPRRFPSGSEDSDTQFDQQLDEYTTDLQALESQLPAGYKLVRQDTSNVDPRYVQEWNGYRIAPSWAFVAPKMNALESAGPLLAAGGILGAAGAFSGLGGASVADAAYSPANALLSGSGGGYGLTAPGVGIGGVGTAGTGLTAGGGLGLTQTAATGGALSGGLGAGGSGMGILDQIFSPSNLVNLAGNVGGGLLSYFGAQNAADTQANSAAQANNALLSMYNQNRADLQPYREVGVNALMDLAKGSGELTKPFGMSDFQSDPGYNFRLSEGLKAIERSNAARGLLMSGGNLKGVNNYAQQSASQEYGNAYNRYQLDQGNKFNRLAALAGIGQTANQQLAGLGSGTAQGVANNLTGAGNAQAAGQVGGMNAITGGIGNALNTYNQNAMLGQLLDTAKALRGSSYNAN